MLAFPTKPYPHDRAKPGYPVRAHSCMCDPKPMVCEGDDTCVKCGKHPRDVVARTWKRRAQQVARHNSKQEAA